MRSFGGCPDSVETHFCNTIMSTPISWHDNSKRGVFDVVLLSQLWGHTHSHISLNIVRRLYNENAGLTCTRQGKGSPLTRSYHTGGNKAETIYCNYNEHEGRPANSRNALKHE